MDKKKIEIDGKWVNLIYQDIPNAKGLSVHSNSNSGWIDLNISSMLPNDDYVYEISIYGQLFQTSSVPNGWTGVIGLRTSINEIRLCGGTKHSDTTNMVAWNGSGTLIVGKDRKFQYHQSQYWDGTIEDLRITAYRRLYKDE